jgi:hypothetical protein
MSTYGNVPADDIDAVRSAARVANVVTMSLPGLSPPGWREIAYEIVLDGILSDWVANGTTELDENDEQDLSNLLRLSADTALVQDESLRDVAFRTILSHTMHDWVENWNEEEE